MFDRLLRALFSNDPPAPRRPETPAAPVPPPVQPGDIFTGTIAYVGTTFAKIQSDGFVAFLRIGEMAPHRLAAAAEAVQQSQEVQFAVLEPSQKSPGEWVASLTAVAEIERRMALARLERNQKLRGEVVQILGNGVRVDAGIVELFIPLAELSWESVSHPAYAVSLGEQVDAMVTRITIPKWRAKWRQAPSDAVASIRNCTPRPKPTFVPMAFSAVQFRLQAQSRRPPHLDPVLLHVLAELVDQRSLDAIQQRTHLPAAVLHAMVALMTEEGLVTGGVPTPKAQRLIEAERLAQDINALPFRGLACNVAEHSIRIMDQDGKVPDPPYPDGYVIPEYPAAWPQPVFHRKADDAFFRLSGSAIPEAIITLLLSKKQRALAETLQGDPRFHISLREDGPRRSVTTYVPDQWIHGALWTAFDALGVRKPYRPAPGVPRATHLLLIAMDAFIDDDLPAERVFYEPYSATFWQLRDAALARLREQSSTAFPAMPTLNDDGLPLQGGAIARRLAMRAWHSVHIRAQA
jgi:small subunit ribosomal protein S1